MIEEIWKALYLGCGLAFVICLWAMDRDVQVSRFVSRDGQNTEIKILIFETHLGHIWAISEKYLGHIQDISGTYLGTYLGQIWDICGTYLADLLLLRQLNLVLFFLSLLIHTFH